MGAESLKVGSEGDSKNKAGLTRGFWFMAMTCAGSAKRGEKQLKFSTLGWLEEKSLLGVIGNYLKKLWSV